MRQALMLPLSLGQIKRQNFNYFIYKYNKEIFNQSPLIFRYATDIHMHINYADYNNFILYVYI